MLFGFYGREEVATASLDGYSKLVFDVFSRCPILVLLVLSSSLFFSTGTGTNKGDGLAALGAALLFLGLYSGGGNKSRYPTYTPLLPIPEGGEGEGRGGGEFQL